MIRNLSILATAADADSRLDRAVTAHCPTTTRAFVLDAIASNDILLNDQPAPKGEKLRPGDRILVRALYEQSDKRVTPEPNLLLTIIHQDDTLLVLDKPAGMPVHPLAPGETGTLANALVAHEPALADIGDDPLFPSLVHRLDTDTSGLIVAARTAAAYTALRTAFHEHRVEKEYRALVHGAPPDTARLQHYLAHHPARPGFMRVFDDRPPNYAGPRLMQAVTEFHVLSRYPHHALLSVKIPTGVTHQIRAQLAAAGFPIVADQLYGPPNAAAFFLTRHFLHAATLAFPHPATNQPARFSSPLPPDLQSTLLRLAK